MSGSINELWQAWLDSQINGTTGVATTSTTGGVTGTNVFTRPAATVTTTNQTNATAVSNGTVYDCGYLALATSVQITSSATLTAGQIKIQGSIDNTSWADMKIIDPVADFTAVMTKIYSFDATNTARYWRVAITTTLVGGNITAKTKSY